MKLLGRDDFDPFRFDIEILALREGSDAHIRVVQIERDYRQFKKLLELLPKGSRMSWEAPTIALELFARIGSWPVFMIEIPASLLRIYYYFQKSSKPRLTGDQIYQLEMKKQETFARRQKAMEEVMYSDGQDPTLRVKKMDNLIVTYCAPYYDDQPAFSRVMEIWRDMVANFTALGDRKELCDSLLRHRLEFVANMIYALSWRSKDIPANNVYVFYNGPTGAEPQRYEYEP